jgi:hypothetical protein
MRFVVVSHGCDYARSVATKQLDEGIGDIFVSLSATAFTGWTE